MIQKIYKMHALTLSRIICSSGLEHFRKGDVLIIRPNRGYEGGSASFAHHTNRLSEQNLWNAKFKKLSLKMLFKFSFQIPPVSFKKFYFQTNLWFLLWIANNRWRINNIENIYFWILQNIKYIFENRLLAFAQPTWLFARSYPKKPRESPKTPKTKITATTEQPIAIHVLVSSQFSSSSLSPVQSSHEWSKSHVKCKLHDVEFSNSNFDFENYFSLIKETGCK